MINLDNYHHIKSLCGADQQIIAVSKKQPIDKITALLANNHKIFAESQLQEALSKWPPLQQQYQGLELHYIGALQSNKIKDICQIFSAIHTIDKLKYLDIIAKQEQKPQLLFLQVNLGSEAQKRGINQQQIATFLEYANNLSLKINGLMVLPPQDKPALPYFAWLKKLVKEHDLAYTSMGMSADYQHALRLGANYIRVGSAIFGNREGS